MMNKVDAYFLAKKVAKMRHERTRYDKHLDLMYDEDGNQTELRHRINNILARIIQGELDKSFLVGVRSEIIEATRQKLKQQKLAKKSKKKPKKPKQQSVEKSYALLVKGIQELQKRQGYQMLKAIGMTPHQLHLLYRKALPYIGD